MVFILEFSNANDIYLGAESCSLNVYRLGGSDWGLGQQAGWVVHGSVHGMVHGWLWWGVVHVLKTVFCIAV